MASGSGRSGRATPAYNMDRAAAIRGLTDEAVSELALERGLAHHFAAWDVDRALRGASPHILGPLVWDAMLNTGVLVDLHLWQVTVELLEAALVAAVVENPELLDDYMVSYDEENDH